MNVKNIKVGDKVLVRLSYSWQWVEGVVVAETKTLWKVEHGDFLNSPTKRITAFRKDTGSEFNSSSRWHSCCMFEFSQARLDEQQVRQERDQLIQELKKVDFSEFSLSSLKAIEAVMKAEKALQEGDKSQPTL